MTRKEKAMELHKSGYNCAQSVIAACCDLVGLDEKTALAIAGGFGGGIRCGEVCGAASGGVMILSLAMPFNETDSENKDKVAAAAKAFCTAFKTQYDAIRCADLLKSHDRKAFCRAAIGETAELVEKMVLGK